MFKMQVGKAGGEKWKSLSATVRPPGSYRLYKSQMLTILFLESQCMK